MVDQIGWLNSKVICVDEISDQNMAICILAKGELRLFISKYQGSLEVRTRW